MVGSSASVVKAANEYFDTLVKSRFIEMFGANVGTIPFDNVMLDSTKLGYKLQSSQYQDKGEIAIIDQGDSDICGYTKRLDHNPFDEECIIFGDHTERFKHIVVPFYSGADGVKILTTDTNEWNYTFLYYYLDIHYHPIGGYSRHFKFLKELTFLQPKMKLQNQFADFVKQVDKSKLLFQQMVSKYDELVKSRFIEMFGDPSNNTKWESKQLKEITSKIGSGATPKGGKSSYIGTDIAFIRSMNVHDCSFLYDDLAHITVEQADKLANVIVEPEDILFNITGASVARCCIVPDDVLPARVNQHVSIIRLDKHVMNPIFFNTMIVSNSMKRTLLNDSKSNGATREAITKEMLSSLEVIIPPIELQNQFADFVKQVDKSKSEILEGIKRLKLQQIAEQ